MLPIPDWKAKKDANCKDKLVRPRNLRVKEFFEMGDKLKELIKV